VYDETSLLGSGLAGWCVQLYAGGVVIATAVTDASGNFVFGVVDGTTYMVCEVQQSAWAQVRPDPAYDVGLAPCPSGQWGWSEQVSLAGAFVFFADSLR
jgi:hypothetical protein